MNSPLFSANDLKMHPSFQEDGYPFFAERLRPAIFASLRAEQGNCPELQQILLNQESVKRTVLPAHLTTSSVVISPEGNQCLMLLHRKIGEWVYPGGHADGDWNLLRSALRECFEETGLESVLVLPPRWMKTTELSEYCPHLFARFLIRATPKEPAHVHYDCVYVFRATTRVVQFDPSESLDLAWFDFSELREHAKRPDGEVINGLDGLTARICLSAMQSALGDGALKGACIDLS